MSRQAISRKPTWPFLVASFGALLLIIAISGLALWKHALQLQSDALETQRGFLEMDRALGELRLQTLSTAIDVRDFAMEESPRINEIQRAKILGRRQKLLQALEDVDRLPASDDADIARLKNQIDVFWTGVDAVLHWSPAERRQKWAEAIHKAVMPGRQAVLNEAEALGALNTAFLERRTASLRASFDDLKQYLLGGLAWVVGLGVLIALVTVWKINSLELRAERNGREMQRLSKELRYLTNALVNVQEAERKSLSRELHDEVGQMMTVLRMELGSAERHVSRNDPDTLRHLKSATTLVEQTLKSVRSLARGLRPAMLDDLGIGPALSWLAREFTKHTGIKVVLNADDSLHDMPERYRTCIYRVTQEALTNCARHAGARSIQVDVRRLGNSWSIEIRDDGKGFEIKKQGTGIGLLGMKERVLELNGELTVESSPNQGTTVSIRLPLPQEVAA
jgi:signal transduction histidine kinase